MVITFAGALRQALLHAFERRTIQLRWRLSAAAGTLNTVEPLFDSRARSPVVSTSAAIFSSLIDGCLKYKNKEKT